MLSVARTQRNVLTAKQHHPSVLLVSAHNKGSTHALKFCLRYSAHHLGSNVAQCLLHDFLCGGVPVLPWHVSPSPALGIKSLVQCYGSW